MIQLVSTSIDHCIRAGSSQICSPSTLLLYICRRAMFKFDFEIDDEDKTADFLLPKEAELEPSPSQIEQVEPFAEHTLPALLERLPPLISYSPLTISDAASNVTLARRDLFDARFQLISGGRGDVESESADSALEFLDAPSDLVPGVYEGGLKTWECSVDLAGYLDTLGNDKGSRFAGKRVLEIGCGTAVPSIFILSRLFNGVQDVETVVAFQDYNASVLELITFPNVVLAWYMSPASEEFRNSATDSELSAADPTVAGELNITPELKTAFLDSLRRHKISLLFYSGPWQSLTAHLTEKYDVILTSETIYRSESLAHLIALLRAACAGPASQPLCLVAAKVLYFGVGGGVSEFVDAVQKDHKGRVETVWEKKAGVGRSILEVTWP
ncbi:unnamed protein product [Mycena citricolor]|nr:unnamed protein product [Mycena citricolor]